MWNKVVSMSEDDKQVIAKLPSTVVVESNFDQTGLDEALDALDAQDLCLLESEVTRFINCAKDGKGDAYEGFVIAESRNATSVVEVTDNDMLATMVITGAYRGRGLRGNEIVHALATAHVTKGINKLALKKVMAVSASLAGGEVFNQPVAQGKMPIQGTDSQFIPLVDDVTKQVLKPQGDKTSTGKLDMRNLGETITVAENEQVMKRIPSTKGEAGFTVQGKIIPPQPGNDVALQPGKGTHISPDNPNLLLASFAGMPLIKPKTIDVDNAMCVKNVSVATGHIKFKGSVVIAGDVEPGMIVKATGSITIGGFIESADVRAQGDIQVGKGIIGHTVSDGEEKTCHVRSSGSITANYAQFSDLQAGQDIRLSVHSMNNEIRCGHDLIVEDGNQKQGTLNGGCAKVGRKIQCVHLGVEGDNATKVIPFARYDMYKEKITKYKEQYKIAQAATMDVIRKEMEFKKKPKAERSDEEAHIIEQMKAQNSVTLEKVKKHLEGLELEFDGLLETATVDVIDKVYTRVSVHYGDEFITTKRVHGPSVFSFNHYEISCESKLAEGSDAESDGDISM